MSPYPPVILKLITDALTTAYWYKRDLRKFLSRCGVPNQVIVSQDWDQAKYFIVDGIVAEIERLGDEGIGPLRRLVLELTRMTDFSHLQHVEDGRLRVKEAKANIELLRSAVKNHDDELTRQRAVREARLATAQNIVGSRRVEEKFEEFRQHFYQIVTSPPQTRGYALEKFLRDLFEFADMSPKGSFRIIGEQIDGAFIMDNVDFLLEAKWQDEPCIAKDLRDFAGKVEEKIDNTLGLFVAINGYSPDGIVAYGKGHRAVILLCDGEDLNAVIERRIDLKELIRRKRTHAAHTGNIYFRVRDLLMGK